MKKEFNLPEIEIVSVENVDVITGSFGQVFAGEHEVSNAWDPEF